MLQPDAITETRASTDLPTPSLWTRLKSYVCPCLLPRTTLTLAEKDSGAGMTSAHSRTSETNHSTNHNKVKQTFGAGEHVAGRRNTKRKNSMEFQENEKRQELLDRRARGRDFRETINIELGYNFRMCSIDELDCSVCHLAENVLLPVGSKGRQLLVKVARVNVSLRVALLKREIAKRQRQERMEQRKFKEYEFNKHWEQRYVLFEKFDEGIKIDENSWTTSPPEAVSEYLASKCNGAKIVLDAFAGVGGNAIKLANINSCLKVIANEPSEEKLGFLLNNAKVYEVDSNIELSQREFLSLNRAGVDVVLVQPELGEMAEHREVLVSDFWPSLDKVIRKALSLGANLLLLLPPETNIDSLCSCISTYALELRRMRDYCSIRVEKIYFQTSIKYLLVCVGTLVQTEVKLNEELEYLYSRLKKPNEVYFKHKKVMKRLREDFGMLDLFNLVKQSERVVRESGSEGRPGQGRKEGSVVEAFYELIRRKGLIHEEKLAKMIVEQDAEYERQSSYFHSITFEDNSLALPTSPMMEEEKKIDEAEGENPFAIREAELTQSEYSHYSYLPPSSFDKKSNKSHRSSAILVRDRNDRSNPSIIINRINNDSKEREASSPLTPSQQIKRGATEPISDSPNAEDCSPRRKETRE